MLFLCCFSVSLSISCSLFKFLSYYSPPPLPTLNIFLFFLSLFLCYCFTEDRIILCVCLLLKFIFLQILSIDSLFLPYHLFGVVLTFVLELLNSIIQGILLKCKNFIGILGHKPACIFNSLSSPPPCLWTRILFINSFSSHISSQVCQYHKSVI